MHVAAIRGNVLVIKTILAHGGLINAKDDKELTPLFYAILFDHKDCAREMLRCEADPKCACPSTWTFTRDMVCEFAKK